MSTTISLRWLAEFIYRGGDLFEPGRGRTTGEEGIATQRAVQKHRPETYQREVAVSREAQLAGETRLLKGRADGADLSASPPLVEEFKTTRLAASEAHARDGVVHLAQLKLYAALLAESRPELGDTWQLDLTYCHPDSLHIETWSSECTARELATFLEDTLNTLAQVLERQRQHTVRRNAWLSELGFPFESYRPHQRAMARRCFSAVKASDPLLIEAPTGSGKSMAVLYPALRSLPDTEADRVLFLTSRTTGAAAATDAVDRLAPRPEQLRTVQVTAKQTACLVEGMPCGPEHCPYARGYFDRRNEAVQSLLALGRAGPQEVEQIARQHEVCPFELSLDAGSWADLLVLDYNYVFDPVVALQRFAADAGAVLLIDEAHQLSPRASDMLSAELRLDVVRTALRAQRSERSGPVIPGCVSRLRSIERALTTLRRMYGDDTEQLIDAPLAVARAADRLMQAWQTEQWDTLGQPELTEALWHASRWLKATGWADTQHYRYLLDTRDGVRLELHCLDPAPHIRRVLDGYRSHVRFSGTVTPLALYQRLHGFDDTPAERVASAYQPQQLCTLIVDDVPTWYRNQQREAGLPKLLAVIRSLLSTRAGRYLVAFPSYGYLAQFEQAVEAARLSEVDLLNQAHWQFQRADLDPDEREAFLDDLAEGAASKVAAIVLGGVFSESVDFADIRLAGVIVVGTGLPPPDLIRKATEHHYNQLGEDGREIAFVQPAMTRVLQVAGRLLRSPDDRGVICLVDSRFANPEYQRFFPAHWQPQQLRHDEIEEVVANFWQGRILSASAGPTQTVEDQAAH